MAHLCPEVDALGEGIIPVDISGVGCNLLGGKVLDKFPELRDLLGVSHGRVLRSKMRNKTVTSCTAAVQERLAVPC